MPRLEITLCDPAATSRLGFLLAASLGAGDIIALSGQLGTGKSVLARGLIQALCPQETDIPSPTFTLVQTYEPADGPSLMHFDLYRLESAEEALDLGIEDAFVEAVSVIEWPERLGPWLPQGALRVSLAADARISDSRIASLEGGARWQPVLDQARAQFAG
ncbi:MAG: tRNA (adenosine(37)-N6)-threonylcarbamoyltransferase complex ATPase subunit type 1 TsaE [Candidatus Puniceispirillaceae bacterium]